MSAPHRTWVCKSRSYSYRNGQKQFSGSHYQYASCRPLRTAEKPPQILAVYAKPAPMSRSNATPWKHFQPPGRSRNRLVIPQPFCMLRCRPAAGHSKAPRHPISLWRQLSWDNGGQEHHRSACLSSRPEGALSWLVRSSAPTPGSLPPKSKAHQPGSAASRAPCSDSLSEHRASSGKNQAARNWLKKLSAKRLRESAWACICCT